MKKIVVTIESNDNEVSNNVTRLLRGCPFNCNYELEINPEYPFQYQKPGNNPYFANNPIYCMTFYYHFAEDINQNQQAHFRELEIFAQLYTQHVKTVMMNSGQFAERLAATQNSALMQVARIGTDLQMEAMRKNLASPAYNPQLFPYSSPKNVSLSEKNNSNIPYYLCGLGLLVAFSAITIPSGMALVLGCLGTLLFLAGGIAFVKNRLANVESEANLNLSPVTP